MSAKPATLKEPPGLPMGPAETASVAAAGVATGAAAAITAGRDAGATCGVGGGSAVGTWVAVGLGAGVVDVGIGLGAGGDSTTGISVGTGAPAALEHPISRTAAAGNKNSVIRTLALPENLIPTLLYLPQGQRPTKKWRNFPTKPGYSNYNQTNGGASSET